jgi:hypothetical protein
MPRFGDSGDYVDNMEFRKYGEMRVKSEEQIVGYRTL